MPDIDVTDLLVDPEIAGDTFDVIRRKQVVDAHGTTTVVPTLFQNVTGSVTPTGDQSLVRAEAYETQANTIKVITTFRLRGVSKEGGDSYLPDVVVWAGSNFEVKSLNDWNRFGAGMMEADCASIDFADQAPT